MNIYDLGFIYFSVGKEKEQFMNRDIDNNFAGSFFLGIIDFFLRFFYYLFFSPFRYKRSLSKDNAVLIYGESINNRNTLSPILKELGEDRVIDLHSHRQYPKWRMYWYAIPHLCELFEEIKKATSEKKDTIKNFFAKFWMMYGCNKTAGQLLDYYNPKALVVANDHLPFHRSLMQEANLRGIPTIYVQHAAVTNQFPPLQFSYSLLDGEDSYQKYKLNDETSGKIFLCGGIRFDAIKQVRLKKPKNKVVGVAINLVDDEKIVKDTCLHIRDSKVDGKSLTVVLRPHPQMQLDMWKKWCFQNGIGFSLAKDESSFAFISRISVLISNQSSIHLDACMCYTPSIVYGLSMVELGDSYCFVKNHLVQRANNMSELIQFIAGCDTYQADAEAVKYYNCSYGTCHEGHVARMMAEMIESILEGNDNDFLIKYGFVAIEAIGNRTVYKI